MQTDRHKLLAEADRAARRGKLDKASDVYRKLVSDSPKDLGLRQKLADSLARGGHESEACKLFVELAQTYWKGGHRSRATATMKRAVRLRPNNALLLFELGGWILELGHPADAKEPLMQAVETRFDARAASSAREAYELLARQLPRDVDVHRALVRVVEKLNDANATALARAGLAVALARSEDPKEAVSEVLQALNADQEQLAALKKVPLLVEVVDEAGAEALQELAAEEEAATQAGISILIAAWHGRHARSDEGAALLSSALEHPEGWSASALGFAAETMADLEQPEASAELVARVLETSPQPRPLQERLIRVLRKLVAAFPEQSRAAELLAEVTSVPIATDAPATPVETARATPPAPEPVESSAPQTPLPPLLQQRLVEARSLFGYGLKEEALAVLEQIDSRWQDHDQVRALSSQILGGKRPKKKRQVTQLPRTGPAIAKSDDEDLLVLTEHDETGALQADGMKPGAASPPVPLGDEELMHVIAVDQVEDDETRYQMAVGLIQMGLEDQAIELLESCIQRPERRAEAALALVRIYTDKGDLRRSLEIGEQSLAAPDLTLRLRCELLAEVAAVAFQEGEAKKAADAVNELDAIGPEHSALAGLKARMMASEN